MNPASIPLNLWWYDAVQIFALILLLSGVGYALVKLSSISSSVASVKTNVHTILTNHLPHIQADVSELRGQFIEHLQNHPKPPA